MNISRSRRNSIRGRVLAGGLLLAVAGAASAAVAPAAAAKPLAYASHASPARAGRVESGAPAAGQITWSISPASATAPDTRLRFSYTSIEPGSTISDHLALYNYSSQSVAFELYATDATGTTAAGALTLLPANTRSTDIGSWVTFSGHVSQLSIIVPGRKAIIEPFTIAVPAHATPGDHTGGMIASVGTSHRNAAGQVVTLYQRIAVPMELRVTGKLIASLQVNSVSAGLSNPLNPFGGGTAHVTYLVTNTGNVRLTGTQIVKVTAQFGSAMVRAPALPVVLPGDSIKYTVSVGGLYPAGSMTARVTVTPGWPKDETPLKLPLAIASGSASLFAVPWSLTVVIILLAVGGYGIARMLRWRRRSHYAEVAAAAEHARLETERRLLGSTGNPASGTE
ncbi:MAG TPA: hypothetical protein VN969_38240 [Streptosporangiaceae bacterium]|nr:hypothetical protein [Streptosporangiaceae bacterium]